jgi:hypothetical protein
MVYLGDTVKSLLTLSGRKNRVRPAQTVPTILEAEYQASKEAQSTT